MYGSISCPIYFEDHTFGGHVASIENFTSSQFGTVRTVIIDNLPYFCNVDLCNGLNIDTRYIDKASIEAASDISMYMRNDLSTGLDDIPTMTNNFKYTSNSLYYRISIPSESKQNLFGPDLEQALFVSEPVLYMLMFKAKGLNPTNFKAWLALEILPELRPLGKEAATDIIVSEASKMMETLNTINANYEKLKNTIGNVNVTDLYTTEMDSKTGTNFYQYNINNKVNNVIKKAGNMRYCVGSYFGTNTIESLNANISSVASELVNTVSAVM